MSLSPNIKILIRDSPVRSIALQTSKHALIIKNNPGGSRTRDRSDSESQFHSNPSVAANGGSTASPNCIAEFGSTDRFDFDTWRQLGFREVFGTLGLITINNDVFLCVVDSATKAAEVRPGEVVQRINSVEFHCLTSARYDHLLSDTVNAWPTDDIDEAGYDLGNPHSDGQPEHPCLAIKKLLSSGTFYYSADFDLTRRLQKRATDVDLAIAVESLDAGFLWNSYMIQPLVDFRTRLTNKEQTALDESRILTSAIRGYCTTITVPWSAAPFQHGRSGLPSALSIISRLSCRRAGTRFNARGIDDDGNVANFVESETIFWSPSGICLSYVQVRGSLPVFWEQATGLLPSQQKITISRSPEATQPAFDKHFDMLEKSYGAVHVVNLLSQEKSQEAQLSRLYRHHIAQSPLNQSSKKGQEFDHRLLQISEYDFHAETRGTSYDAARGIRSYISNSASSFVFFLSEEQEISGRASGFSWKSLPILQQEGIFRTNCLDCLDRTNVVQGFISQMALETFFTQQHEPASPDFWVRHQTLWADNGDQLSRIYAGTGALKSSFTRHGKMSLGGFMSDARKSATRMYMNNFVDKGRQNTIDLLLGRLVSQQPVHLYDPMHEWVQYQLHNRSGEFTTSQKINILAATFNLNGKDRGMKEDLGSWLWPNIGEKQANPHIIVVAFQEIVELSPQQIMSTDPHRRQYWEEAVKMTLNENAQNDRMEDYVLLRGAQLVGASLSIFVRTSSLPYIKNVEGSIKKTGLSGMAGNKGAVAIRIEYADTSICFVTAHLAAGFANYDERNRDYKTITSGLRFQRNRSIDDHESVIWLGDFNYRIGLSNDKTRHLISAGDLDTLYKNDQLNIQMTHGNVFSFYEEAKIKFNPTYKFNNGTDEYDTSDKSRVPAWTDRILKKGQNLQQTHYDIANLRFSDHRPVYAAFICTINVVDEKVKDQITKQLFAQSMEATGNGQLLDKSRQQQSDNELPPPTSSRRKWFLDNGKPARSTVQSPSSAHLLNENRPSNPFAATDEPDWVKVEKDNIPAPPPPRRSGQTPSLSNVARNGILPKPTNGSQTTKPIATRRRILAPAPGEIAAAPPLPARSPSMSTTSTSTSQVTPSRLSQASSLSDIKTSTPQALSRSSTGTRKAAPPVRPQKPSALSSTAVSPVLSRASSMSGSRSLSAVQTQPSQDSSVPPMPSLSRPNHRPSLPPKKSSLSNSPGPANNIAPTASDSAPSLPPRKPEAGAAPATSDHSKRTVSNGLLDDPIGEDNLKDYVVLNPTR